MPHKPTTNWRLVIPDLQSTINRERAAAVEWKTVASNLSEYLQHIDLAMSMIIGEANKIEKVFNIEAPNVDMPPLSPEASGEELYRSVRAKTSAMVNFIVCLTREALAAEEALQDVHALANAALVTMPPVSDLAPTDTLRFDPVAWGLELVEPNLSPTYQDKKTRETSVVKRTSSSETLRQSDLASFLS